MTDIIVIVNGSPIPIRVNDKDVKVVTDQLDDAMKESKKGGTSITYFKIGTACMTIANINGYYCKNVVETASDKAVRLLEQALKSNKEGEEWKDV